MMKMEIYQKLLNPLESVKKYGEKQQLIVYEEIEKNTKTIYLN